MGTDIHSSVEIFNKKTKKWKRKALYYQDYEGAYKEAWMILDNRDYNLFGKLAGVRSMEEPFVYPRGLPDDISDETKELYGDGTGCHTATWYDYCELNLYADTDKAYFEYEIYDADKDEWIVDSKQNVVRPYIDKIDMILEAYHMWYPKPGEVRIIMWFDS